MACGVSPTWPITATPAPTTRRTDSVRTGPPPTDNMHTSSCREEQLHTHPGWCCGCNACSRQALPTEAVTSGSMCKTWCSSCRVGSSASANNATYPYMSGQQDCFQVPGAHDVHHLHVHAAWHPYVAFVTRTHGDAVCSTPATLIITCGCVAGFFAHVLAYTH